MFDFVYLDARHDYCAVAWELEAYWPKVRAGGILGGDDFVAAEDAARLNLGDWSLCADGSHHPGAVKAAVLEFVDRHDLHLQVSYMESNRLLPNDYARDDQRHRLSSWFVRKPLHSDGGAVGRGGTC